MDTRLAHVWQGSLAVLLIAGQNVSSTPNVPATRLVFSRSVPTPVLEPVDTMQDVRLLITMLSVPAPQDTLGILSLGVH